MIISNETPVVIPSTVEKLFPHQWIYNLSCHCPTLTQGRIFIELLPYDADTKEFGPSSGLEVLTTDKFWEAINEVPEVANAFAAVINSVEPLRAWIKVKNTPPPDPTPIPDPEPEPEPDPTPEPAPEPDPAPAPAPEPDPVPEPDPAPEPDPLPEDGPV
jgi:outer membrane biosynthesis protein TonB